MRHTRRRRITGGQEAISIVKAGNGYIVTLPFDYGPDEIDYSSNRRDEVLSLFTMDNIAKIMQIMQRIKAGEDYQDLLAEKEPKDNEAYMPTAGPGGAAATEPENNVYVFATWEDAAAFIKSQYDN